MSLNGGPTGDQSWFVHFAMASFETYHSLKGLPWSILLYKMIQLITLSGSSSP